MGYFFFYNYLSFPLWEALLRVRGDGKKKKEGVQRLVEGRLGTRVHLAGCSD